MVPSFTFLVCTTYGGTKTGRVLISTTVDTPCLEPLRAAYKDKNLMSYSPLGEACCNCDLRASVDSLRATTSTNMTPPLHTGEDVYAISTASSSRSSLCSCCLLVLVPIDIVQCTVYAPVLLPSTERGSRTTPQSL